MRRNEPLFQLRRLYASQGIAGFYPHVLRLVSLVIYAGNYPTAYSPNRQWDQDSFIMLANDFSVQILEKNGYLAHLLRMSRDTNNLYSTLETVFRHFLISQKTRTVEDNLYRRIIKLLAANSAFEMLGSGPRSHKQLWKLSDIEVRRFTVDQEELLLACRSIDPVPAKDGKPDSKKLPTLIATGPLTELVTEIFKAAQSALTAAQIAAVVQQKLGLIAEATISLDEPVAGTEGLLWQDLLEDERSVENSVEITMAAEVVLRQLNHQEREAITLYARGASMDEIARAQGRSKSSVHNYLYIALAKIKEAGVGDIEDAKKVLSAIAEATATF